MPALLSDAAALKAVADPVRIRIGILLSEEARTVKELAGALNVPPTRLYYHVKILEAQGLIEVAERRMVSGIEERRYRAVEDAFTATDGLRGSDLANSGVLPALFGAIQAEMQVVLQDHPDAELSGLDSALPILTMTDLTLTREELIDVQNRLAQILDHYATPAREDAPAGARRFHFVFAGYQRPGDHGAA